MSKINNTNTVNNKKKKDVAFWIIWGALFFSICFSYIFLGLRFIIVNGSSMEPTYHDKQIVVSNKLYKNFEINQGDIIVAKCDGLNENIIKRVIADEGQKVYINYETDTIYVDGKAYKDPINVDMINFTDIYDTTNPVRVPKGCVFVLGDNRNNSLDSRNSSIGFVSKKDIFGKVLKK